MVMSCSKHFGEVSYEVMSLTIISVGSRAALEALIPYIQNQGKAAKIDDA